MLDTRPQPVYSSLMFPRSFNACLRRAIRWSFRGYRYKTPVAPVVFVSIPVQKAVCMPTPCCAQVPRKVDKAISCIGKGSYPVVNKGARSTLRPAAVKRNGGLRGSTATRWTQ